MIFGEAENQENLDEEGDEDLGLEVIQNPNIQRGLHLPTMFNSFNNQRLIIDPEEE